MTEEQLAVVREVFEHVDSGNKGWLCGDDVQHIVQTLNSCSVAQLGDSRHAAATDSSKLSKSQALERTRMDVAAEYEQFKQDSAREPTSPVPDDDTARSCDAGRHSSRWARPVAALTDDEMGKQVKEAEKEQMREKRRRRKLAEREAATTTELLKVLVPPDSAQLQKAGGAGAEPPVRLSFEIFTKAVDVAMLHTSIETGCRTGTGKREHGVTATGARPGELYCRKIVTHWRRARGGYYDNVKDLDTSDDRDAVGADTYAEMLELLVPLSVRDASEAFEDECL